MRDYSITLYLLITEANQWTKYTLNITKIFAAFFIIMSPLPSPAKLAPRAVHPAPPSNTSDEM